MGSCSLYQGRRMVGLYTKQWQEMIVEKHMCREETIGSGLHYARNIKYAALLHSKHISEVGRS